LPVPVRPVPVDVDVDQVEPGWVDDVTAHDELASGVLEAVTGRIDAGAFFLPVEDEALLHQEVGAQEPVGI
jgi:hypothetical protein